MNDFFEHLYPFLNEICVFGVTALVAYLKKKYDIKKMSNSVESEVTGRIPSPLKDSIIDIIKNKKHKNGSGN